MSKQHLYLQIQPLCVVSMRDLDFTSFLFNIIPEKCVKATFNLQIQPPFVVVCSLVQRIFTKSVDIFPFIFYIIQKICQNNVLICKYNRPVLLSVRYFKKESLTNIMIFS